ncbi:MAG: succinate dehydrogenase/fumarate reductase iron-sulfur subunit [Lachnospiraceae bacterium]|nr:succinate dehydrogenase/fumarate reductase iron-sulfur subunit [Lachnospiraceae bacterium]
MEVLIEIKRQEDVKSSAYFQSIRLTPEKENLTVASLLREINANPDIRDMEGGPVPYISWECSCLQKKCGACAILVNGRPRLACDTFIRDYMKKDRLTLAPLSKFPIIKDLIVDRSILYNNLRDIKNYLEEEVRLTDKNTDTAYEASRCLMCGCCLEVCPNFYVGGDFYGAASFVPATRLITAAGRGGAEELKREYREHIYKGCGKSLACKDICPAGIDMDKMLSKSNEVAVWKSLFKR